VTEFFCIQRHLADCDMGSARRRDNLFLGEITCSTSDCSSSVICCRCSRERGSVERIPSSVTSSSPSSSPSSSRSAAVAAETAGNSESSESLVVVAVDNDDNYATINCRSSAENVVRRAVASIPRI